MGSVINVKFGNKENGIISSIRENRDVFFSLDETLKYDYNLIKEIFDEFKYDLPFLEKVLDDITQNVKDDWSFEFSIRYLELLESQRQFNIRGYLVNDPVISLDLRISVFQMAVSAKSDIMMDRISSAIKNTKAKSIGMGFLVILDMFSYSDVIKAYYAKEYIRRIFQNPSLEMILHQSYQSFEDVESKGIKTFIVDYVSKRDEALGYYIINHPQALIEVNYAMECVKSNWQIYIRTEENNVFNQIGEDIYRYIPKSSSKSLENGEDVIDRIWEAAYYVAYELGILERFYTQIVAYDPKYIKELEADFERTCFDDKSREFKIDYEAIKRIILMHLNNITDLNNKQKMKLKNGTNH